MVKKIGLCMIFLSAACWAAGTTPPQVNGRRILQHLQSLAEYGKNPQGGVSRVAYSAADLAGREYVMGLMREAGLAVSIDVAGNLMGTRAGTDSTLKPIIIGSHIDSVPEGGNYDGDVGSLGSIEVAQTASNSWAATPAESGKRNGIPAACAATLSCISSKGRCWSNSMFKSASSKASSGSSTAR